MGIVVSNPEMMAQALASKWARVREQTQQRKVTCMHAWPPSSLVSAVLCMYVCMCGFHEVCLINQNKCKWGALEELIKWGAGGKGLFHIVTTL